MLGVKIRRNPLARRCASIPSTRASWTRKIAWTSGLLRSSVLQFSRVSMFASVTPLGSRGSGVAAALITSIRSGIISKPFLATFASLTTPAHLTTSSGWSAFTTSVTSLATAFFGAVTWTIPVLFLTRTKLIPPRSLTSWTHPYTVTVSPSLLAIASGERVSSKDYRSLSRPLKKSTGPCTARPSSRTHVASLARHSACEPSLSP